MAYRDTMTYAVTVTMPTSTDAPGNNGGGLATATYSMSRSSFTPTGGGTMIRQ